MRNSGEKVKTNLTWFSIAAVILAMLVYLGLATIYKWPPYIKEPNIKHSLKVSGFKV